MKIGGIDVGTTGCKLSVYDEKGNFLNKEYVTYEVSRKTGEHEIDGAVIWQGVKTVIRQSTEKLGNIDAIGVTTFGETFVMLDENDNILFPSMLYTDPRGEEEAASFCEKEVISIAGVKPHAMYSLPKIMWIKHNHPHVYNKAKRIMLFEDYIVYMLTGTAQLDRSLAARTMALDIKKCEWSKKLFDFAGIDISKMSKVVKAGTVAGQVKDNLKAELGLSDTVIVSGSHDQVASACGAGALEVGYAVDGTGTVECVTPVFGEIPDKKEVYDGGYSVVPYINDGQYVCYALSFTGGAAIKWFRDNFAAGMSYDELNALVTDAVGDVLVLPHFAGAANPYMDSHSKAAFVGVTLETAMADLYRAVMEGVTYEMLLNLRYLGKAGIKPGKLYATGGGAKSRVWLQIKADILNVPITPIDAPEVGALGTIMLTAVAVGVFKDLKEAAHVMIKEGETFYPNPEKHKIYMEKYKKYERLYNAVRPLNNTEV